VAAQLCSTLVYQDPVLPLPSPLLLLLLLLLLLC
jgi:hypothetical protein